MMKRLSLMLATLTWLVAGQVSPASAIWLEGNELVEWCLSDETHSETFCIGYVLGIADVVDTLSDGKVAGFKPVCIDQTTVTSGQLQRVVVKYLKDHPEETHTAAVFLVTVALREAFPCQA